MRAYEISVSVCSLEHLFSSWMLTSWLVGTFDILQSHDQEQGSRSLQYLLVIWSFGCDGDAQSQQLSLRKLFLLEARRREKQDPLLAVPTSPTPYSAALREGGMPPPHTHTAGSTDRKAIVSWSTEINKAIQTTLINPTRLWERKENN